MSASRAIVRTLKAGGADLHGLARLIPAAAKHLQAEARKKGRLAIEVRWWSGCVRELLEDDWLVEIERQVAMQAAECLRLGVLPTGNLKMTIKALFAEKTRRDLEAWRASRRRKKGGRQ